MQNAIPYRFGGMVSRGDFVSKIDQRLCDIGILLGRWTRAYDPDRQLLPHGEVPVLFPAGWFSWSPPVALLVNDTAIALSSNRDTIVIARQLRGDR